MNAGRDVLDAAGLPYLAEQYLQGADPCHPLASPGLADLTGLPPLLVQVGTAELIQDDARLLAERGRACGVEVVLEEWPEMFHGWHNMAFMLTEACQAIARCGEFIAAHRA